MNKVILMGRLVADPEIRYAQGENAMCVARYRLAVDRKSKEGGTDFIPCVAFGRSGVFAEKYLHKGMKIAVEGRIQTGSYTNKDNQKVYTTDIVVEGHEFCESKGQAAPQNTAPESSSEEFMNVPDTWQEELPFS